MNDVEIINTKSDSVSCFGKEAPFDHPKIYLRIKDNESYVICPYCSKQFTRKSISDT